MHKNLRYAPEELASVCLLYPQRARAQHGRHSVTICRVKKPGALLPNYGTWVKSSNLSEAQCPHP